MTQEIYIDVYFSFNFLMDFVVLLITGILIKSSKKLIRLILGALLGALYASVILVCNLNHPVMFFLTYFGMAWIINCVAFGRINHRSVVRNLLVMYGVTFAANGIINALHYETKWGSSILQIAHTDSYGDLSISFVLLVVIAGVTIVSTCAEQIRSRIKSSKNFYEVQIRVGARRITVIALCDTGNSLTDPMTKKPVSVLEEKQFERLKRNGERYFLIPYHCVGTEHGLMRAFIADEITIGHKSIRNAMIGIYKGVLSRKKLYQMILHPDIIEEGENKCLQRQRKLEK